MNSKTEKTNPNTDLNRAKKALGVLHEKVNRVLGAIPNFMELDNLPKQKATTTEKQLWQIFAFGEYPVKTLMRDASLPVKFMPDDPEFVFYNTEYARFIEKTITLIDVSRVPSLQLVEEWFVNRQWIRGHNKSWSPASLEPPILLFMDEYVKFALSDEFTNSIRSYKHGKSDERAGDKIGFSFLAARDALIFAKLHLEDHYASLQQGYPEVLWKRLSHEVDGENVTDNCDKILRMSCFEPDNWARNEDMLRGLFPIDLPQELKNTAIYLRILEIYRSFIFGNWHAVIALSRSLLQYAIVDKASDLGVDAYEDKEKFEMKKLSELIEEISTKDKFEELREEMEDIRIIGNEIMHPKSEGRQKKDAEKPLGKLGELNINTREQDAKRCVTKITKVIGALYGG